LVAPGLTTVNRIRQAETTSGYLDHVEHGNISALHGSLSHGVGRQSRSFAVCEDRFMESGGFELGTDGPTRILVGVDGSDTSLRAAAYAAGLARRQGARLIVLYAKPAPVTAINAPGTAAAVIQNHDEIAADLLAQIKANAPRVGIDVELVVRDGSPYTALLRLAEERKVDAIVVGASMQAGHKLVGSLAAKLVRRATWPVTVVP
jgi:nucleotide-binding universal stress UspA family protein